MIRKKINFYVGFLVEESEYELLKAWARENNRSLAGMIKQTIHAEAIKNLTPADATAEKAQSVRITELMESSSKTEIQNIRADIDALKKGLASMVDSLDAAQSHLDRITRNRR